MIKKVAALIFASAMFGASAGVAVETGYWTDVRSFCKQYPNQCVCDPHYNHCIIK